MVRVLAARVTCATLYYTLPTIHFVLKRLHNYYNYRYAGCKCIQVQLCMHAI